jgi:hypothetical protein
MNTQISHSQTQMESSKHIFHVAPNQHSIYSCLCILPSSYLPKMTIWKLNMLRNKMESVKMPHPMRTAQTWKSGLGKNVFLVYLINTLPRRIFLQGFLFCTVFNVIGLSNTLLKCVLEGNLSLTIKFSCLVQLTSK